MEEKPRSKRGAPKGNKNARKYGLYSRVFTEAEQREWKSAARGQLQPEINLFRVLIARTAHQLLSADAQPFSFGENLAALHVVSMAVARLNSFCRTNEKLLVEDDSSSIKFPFLRRNFEEKPKAESGFKEKTRGGQMGNTNALKYGLYASIFNPEEIRKLDKIEEREIDDEIDLIRTLIKRTVDSMFAQQDLDHLGFLKALRVITYAGSCVEKLACTSMLVFPGPSIYDLILEQVRRWNAKQGVS